MIEWKRKRAREGKRGGTIKGGDERLREIYRKREKEKVRKKEWGKRERESENREGK